MFAGITALPLAISSLTNSGCIKLWNICTKIFSSMKRPSLSFEFFSIFWFSLIAMYSISSVMMPFEQETFVLNFLLYWITNSIYFLEFQIQYLFQLQDRYKDRKYRKHKAVCFSAFLQLLRIRLQNFSHRYFDFRFGSIEINFLRTGESFDAVSRISLDSGRY